MMFEDFFNVRHEVQHERTIHQTSTTRTRTTSPEVAPGDWCQHAVTCIAPGHWSVAFSEP